MPPANPMTLVTVSTVAGTEEPFEIHRVLRPAALPGLHKPVIERTVSFRVAFCEIVA